MWVVVVGGAFGLVTLLVKAVIDAGSRAGRLRATLSADLELLRSIPDDLASSRELLREKVERTVTEYAGSRQNDAPVRPSDLPVGATAPSPRPQRHGVIPMLVAVVVLMGLTVWFAVGAIQDVKDIVQVDGEGAAVLQALPAALVGGALGLTFAKLLDLAWDRQHARRRAPTDEEPKPPVTGR